MPLWQVVDEEGNAKFIEKKMLGVFSVSDAFMAILAILSAPLPGFLVHWS